MIPITYADPRYPEAEKHVRASKTGISIPMIGRLLGIGYNRAERLMDALIFNGVVEELTGPKSSCFRLKELINNPCKMK